MKDTYDANKDLLAMSEYISLTSNIAIPPFVDGFGQNEQLCIIFDHITKEILYTSSLKIDWSFFTNLKKAIFLKKN